MHKDAESMHIKYHAWHLNSIIKPIDSCMSLLSVITASSTRKYVISLQHGSTQSRSYQFRETITFQGCQHDEAVRAVPPTQVLSVDQVFVKYYIDEQLMRYATRNKIGDGNGEGRSGLHDG